MLEVWQLREWQGEKELLIHNIKREIPFHLSVGGAPSKHGGQVLSWEIYSGHHGPKALL